MTDGKPTDWAGADDYGVNNNDLTNVTFQGVGGNANQQCGIFSQGGNSPYQMQAEGVNFSWLVYGVVQATSELNSATNRVATTFSIGTISGCMAMFTRGSVTTAAATF